MTEGVLRVLYAHKGFEVPLQRLGVITVADEGRIKQALARHLIVPISWLDGSVMKRDPQGNVTLRLAYE